MIGFLNSCSLDVKMYVIYVRIVIEPTKLVGGVGGGVVYWWLQPPSTHTQTHTGRVGQGRGRSYKGVYKEGRGWLFGVNTLL